MKCKYCGRDLLEKNTVCPNCKKNNEEVMEEFADLKERKAGFNYFLVFLIVFLLGVIGFGYYYVTKPDVVFNTLLNKVYKEALTGEEIFEQLKMTTTMNIKIDAPIEYKEYTDIINNINFSINEHIDVTDNTFKLEVVADYKEKLLANIDAYYKDNTMYFELKDMLDKIIKVDITKENKEEINLNDLYDKDSKTIINKLYEALKASLKNGTYVSSDTKLNGISVSKNELVINNENKGNIVNAFIDYLLNSNDFIDSVSKIFSVDRQEIVDFLNEMKNLGELKEEIRISIYTKKLTNDFVKLEVGNKENIILSLTLEKEDMYNIEIADINGIKIVSTITVDEKNNKMKLVTESAIDDIKVTINMNMFIIYNEKIDEPNIENSITIEELSEDDINQLMTKLMENEGISEIMKSIETIMSNDIILQQEELNVEEY